MQTSKDQPHHHNPCLQHNPDLPIHLGLQNPKSKSSIMLSHILSPTQSPVLVSGDYIGVESYVDVLRDGDVEESDNNIDRVSYYSQKVRAKIEEKRVAMKKRMEIPPPIPMLAQTENLHSRMPWVLRRHYTGDGRLVLTEEKVGHHEYFRAHRSNGRLTLQLVPLDDEGSPQPLDQNNENDDGCEEDNLELEECDLYRDSDDSDDEEEEKEVKEEEGAVDDHDHDDGVINDAVLTSSLKCLSINNVGITGSPCIFGVPVPAIRQVHS